MNHLLPRIGLLTMIATALVVGSAAYWPITGAAPLDEVPVQIQREWFADWNLESRVSKAQLIMVARVGSVSPITVVHGAKAETNLREYRFAPVSILKGVFTRPELSMTDSDLGLPAPDPNVDAPLKPGEHILLVLTRSRGLSAFSCVGLQKGVSEQRQLITPLSGLDDPIVSMTKTMIRIAQSRSQQQRVELCFKELNKTSGPATVPLLLSLDSRGYWIRSSEQARLLTGLTDHESSAIRTAAASVVCRVLTSEAPIQDDDRKLLAGVLQSLLESKTVATSLRADAVRALGYLGEFGRRSDWVSQVLLDHLQALTHAERAAAATALAKLKNPDTTDAVLAALQSLPLDEYKTWESTWITAAVGLANTKAAPVLLNRLQKKLNGGHAALPEIHQLGLLKYHAAIPTLILAIEDGKHRDEIPIADAFAAIKDDRAVPALAELLKSTNSQTRSAAMRALNSINSDTVVAAIRPQLQRETDLAMKLHIAEVLGRHGINDGYNIAMEHLADPGMTITAARTLAAMKDPRTSAQLWKSVDESHDTAWTGAALQGLAAIKDPKVHSKLQTVLADERSPLLPAAIAATETLGDPSLVAAVTPFVLSRNYQTAFASISAINTLAAAADRQKSADTDSLKQAGTALIEVLNDPDIHVNLRIAALNTLQTLKDARLPATLKTLANGSLPENSPLQKSVHAALTAS